MSGLIKCKFCGEVRWGFEPELGFETTCDCSSSREYHYCRKSSCSNPKGIGEEYCSQHQNCCKYERGWQSCENKAEENGYCCSHYKPCSSYVCSERISR